MLPLPTNQTADWTSSFLFFLLFVSELVNAVPVVRESIASRRRGKKKKKRKAWIRTCFYFLKKCSSILRYNDLWTLYFLLVKSHNQGSIIQKTSRRGTLTITRSFWKRAVAVSSWKLIILMWDNRVSQLEQLATSSISNTITCLFLMKMRKAARLKNIPVKANLSSLSKRDH